MLVLRLRMLKVFVITCLLFMTGCAQVELNVPKYTPDRFTKNKLELVVGGEYRTMKQINDYVNAYPYKKDYTLYGVPDYWATPEEFFLHGGDCEDFAIAKYYLLAKSGKRLSDMHLLTAFDNYKGQYHAVLLVGDKVLDNQNKYIVSYDVALLRYTILAEAEIHYEQKMSN